MAVDHETGMGLVEAEAEAEAEADAGRAGGDRRLAGALARPGITGRPGLDRGAVRLVRAPEGSWSGHAVRHVG